MSRPSTPNSTTDEPTKPSEASKRKHIHEAEGAAGGAITGAAVGAIAGPPGLAAGAVIGGVIGAVVTKVAEEEAERDSFHDAWLDAEIGVEGGELGAPNLEHPPARVGAYSAASSGAAPSGQSEAAEGPMQPPDE
jgi:hypothetical protein